MWTIVFAAVMGAAAGFITCALLAGNPTCPRCGGR